MISFTSYNKKPAQGQSMKRAREAVRVNTCPFREPVNGVMPDATVKDFSAVACFGNEQPPAGWVRMECAWLAARVYVRP